MTVTATVVEDPAVTATSELDPVDTTFDLLIGEVVADYVTAHPVHGTEITVLLEWEGTSAQITVPLPVVRLLFVLPTVTPDVTVRLDTDDVTDTPAVFMLEGSSVLIDDSELLADSAGELPRVVTENGPNPLWLKTLDAPGGDPVGDPVEVTGIEEGEASDAPPIIACKLEAGNLLRAWDWSPFNGRILPSWADYTGHYRTLTGGISSGSATTLTTTITSAPLADLSAGEIFALGSAGGLSTDASHAYITRLDTPGTCRVIPAAALSAPGEDDYRIIWDTINNSVGTPGVSIVDGNIVLAAGTYIVAVRFAIDVFWG